MTQTATFTMMARNCTGQKTENVRFQVGLRESSSLGHEIGVEQTNRTSLVRGSRFWVTYCRRAGQMTIEKLEDRRCALTQRLCNELHLT